MELSDISFGGTKAAWNCMEYSMEFHGTKLYFIWPYQRSMEFHGIFHGIPWRNIPWNSMELSYISFGRIRDPWNIPWNSMEHLCHLKWRPLNYVESHGTR